MNTEPLEHLQSLYDSIENRYPISAGSPALAEAVHFQSNRDRPIHRWFHFKEGFSADLFRALGINADILDSQDSIFIDPFCGCGTTLLAGDLECQWQAHRIGFEINPFLAFVAATKANWRDFDPDDLTQTAENILSVPLCNDFSHMDRPELSTFHRSELIDPGRLSELLDSVQRIQLLNIPERDLLLLGVAATIERVSFYRKDGRALRILRSPKHLYERNSRTVTESLRQIWSLFASDLRALSGGHLRRPAGRATILQDDGRLMPHTGTLGVGQGDVDLMLYSPPYLNHIDYTEVYKAELWLLGFVRTRQQMLSLRKQTFRSHASVRVDHANPNLSDNLARAVDAATKAIIISKDSWHQNFGRLCLAYLADMQSALHRQYALLRPGSQSICIVANSAHGSKQSRIPVATDLFVASLAETVGFHVEQILIARQLRRRDHLNRFLRESAIVLRRPSA